MPLDILISILIVWNLVGFFITLTWSVLVEEAHWSLYNPVNSYDCYYKVNWFGAIVISLIYTALCPAIAIIYWFCVLCTVGRKG